ncbi:Wzz/FepE/Etk N-terminal domain-containing protein [Enterococcus faecalis]|uniref:YveK family protein n=1 Tax=Enterococcus faecalis TaxID=1351 RepID=UPI0020905410|nr:Wzz/FepE/Etk N-terminal domain-containing protein [Enterococcus faecalis]MCO5432265.1 Wzz/FepE/Etk N-terminal domain-containing protein [Enterococcus faecalis]
MVNSNLKKTFLLLKSKLPFIAIVSCLLGLGTYMYTKKFVAPVYQAKTQLVGKYNKQSGSGQNDLNEANYKLVMVNTYKSIVKSNAILQPVKEKLSKENNIEISIEQLENMVTVSQEENSQVFTVVINSKDPNLAGITANKIANVLQENIMDILGVENEISIISAARTAEKPISPNEKLNAMIGVIIGLTISSTYIFIKDTYNQAIDEDDQFDMQLGLVDLGSISFINLKK